MTNRTNAGVAPGRPPATTREKLEETAFALFAADGFDTTTVDDIVAAAGIGRRTFFRYFASKNDLVWGDFGTEVELIRTLLDATPPDVPALTAVTRAVVAANRDRAAHPVFRQRMRLATSVPTLQAHATLQFAPWRQAIAVFVADRAGVTSDDLVPQALAHAVLGAVNAAVLHWLTRQEVAQADAQQEDAQQETAALGRCLDVALGALATGFAGIDRRTARPA